MVTGGERGERVARGERGDADAMRRAAGERAAGESAERTHAGAIVGEEGGG